MSAAQAFFRDLDRMMDALGAQNVEASAAIKELYREYLDHLVLEGYADLESALGTGGLVPLPRDPARYNVVARLNGEHPIGEKDLDNQASYVAARPATMGALLEIASRVEHGPLEVTSLVRHSNYQETLRSTNPNATTAVPMHTMGLAVDIALINSLIETVQQTLAVLEQMRDAGDILFIAERHQLVFHVVPHPTRLGHFTEVFARAMADPGGMRIPTRSRPGLNAFAPPPKIGAAHVSAEVIDVRPTDEFAAEWWASVDTEGADAQVIARVDPAVPSAFDERPASPYLAGAVLGGIGLLGPLAVAAGIFGVRRARREWRRARA